MVPLHHGRSAAILCRPRHPNATWAGDASNHIPLLLDDEAGHGARRPSARHGRTGFPRRAAGHLSTRAAVPQWRHGPAGAQPSSRVPQSASALLGPRRRRPRELRCIWVLGTRASRNIPRAAQPDGGPIPNIGFLCCGSSRSSASGLHGLCAIEFGIFGSTEGSTEPYLTLTSRPDGTRQGTRAGGRPGLVVALLPDAAHSQQRGRLDSLPSVPSEWRALRWAQGQRRRLGSAARRAVDA